ncbi:MAG: serine hydrolase domain-containing protein [Pseudomonadota bacterium]
MFSKKLMCAAILSTLLPIAALASTPVASSTLVGKMEADTALLTSVGTQITGAPGWSVRRDGALTVFEAPEEGNRITLFDTTATDAQAAISAAWSRVGGKNAARKPTTVAPATARFGWDERVIANYVIPDEEKVAVQAVALRAGTAWTVMLIEATPAVADKRSAAFDLMISSLTPRGYSPENFTGKTPNKLNPERIGQFRAFLAQAIKDLGVPGASFALLDGGKVVHAGGVGVRELGKPALVDANTMFMAASNTKGMSTLLLAKLADQGKLRWDQPVTQLYPAFKLGTDAVTSQVLVKHLVCACTGLPRQDLEWIFEFKNSTPLTSMKMLGTNSPTSGFGELYQYNNLMASAAGYVGGALVYPKMELGRAYDTAMEHHIFAPLAMRQTHFDMARAMRSNHASPHATSLAERVTVLSQDFNYSVVPHRPAGGVWTTATDLARYVQLEANEGRLPNGKQLVSKENLLARRAPQVASGKNLNYGMGLEVERVSGVDVLTHGGSLLGYKSNFYLLPDSGIGAVILTNSDEGGRLLRPVMRRLIELVFDAKPEAAEDVKVSAKRATLARAAAVKLNTSPADPAIVAQLAARYSNPLLGEIRIRRQGSQTLMDTGEMRISVATRKNASGSAMLVTEMPGFEGLELTVGQTENKRTLTLNDAQHEYRFTEI